MEGNIVWYCGEDVLVIKPKPKPKPKIFDGELYTFFGC